MGQITTKSFLVVFFLSFFVLLVVPSSLGVSNAIIQEAMTGNYSPTPYQVHLNKTELSSGYKNYRLFDKTIGSGAGSQNGEYLNTGTGSDKLFSVMIMLDLGQGNATYVSGYNLSNTPDNGNLITPSTAMPESWIVYGSNTNCTIIPGQAATCADLVVLDTREHQTFSSFSQTLSYSFVNNNAYRYLFFLVTNISDRTNDGESSNGILVIGELTFLTDGVPVNTPPVVQSVGLSAAADNLTLLFSGNITDAELENVTYDWRLFKDDVLFSSGSDGFFLQGINRQWRNQSITQTGDYVLELRGNDGVNESAPMNTSVLSITVASSSAAAPIAIAQSVLIGALGLLILVFVAFLIISSLAPKFLESIVVQKMIFGFVAVLFTAIIISLLALLF